MLRRCSGRQFAATVLLLTGILIMLFVLPLWIWLFLLGLLLIVIGVVMLTRRC